MRGALQKEHSAQNFSSLIKNVAGGGKGLVKFLGLEMLQACGLEDFDSMERVSGKAIFRVEDRLLAASERE